MEAPWVFIPYGIDVHPKESTMSLLVSRLNYVPINFPEIMPNIRSGSVCLNFELGHDLAVGISGLDGVEYDAARAFRHIVEVAGKGVGGYFQVLGAVEGLNLDWMS